MSYYFIKSNKNKNLLVVDNFLLRKRSQSGQTSYWTCINKECFGKAKTYNNEYSGGMTDHCHEPASSEIIQRMQRSCFKEAVDLDQFETGREIYRTANEKLLKAFDYCETVYCQLKTYSSVSSTILNYKHKKLPPLPHDALSIVIPDEFKKLTNGENFLVKHETTENIIIFGTLEFIKIMCDSKELYMDGTFKITPDFFCQLYTIHVLQDGLMIPVIYGLLPNKETSTYKNFFRHIQDYCCENGLNFDPESFHIDFEMSMIRAINTIFPRSRILGCIFHFSQCVWRAVQKFGLVSDYQFNLMQNLTAKTVKRLFSLPLIKPDDIIAAFELTVAEAPDNDNMTDLLKYFYDNFIKLNCRFNFRLWSHYQSVTPRSTNHVEGWHNKLNRMVGVSHPNIWVLLSILIKIQFESKVSLHQQQSGLNTIEVKRKEVRRRNRIEELITKYNNGIINLQFFIYTLNYI